MNQAHWHLLINHLPIIGTYFSAIVHISGLILKNQTVKISELFPFTIFLALPELLTAEGAEDILNSIGPKNEYFNSLQERLAQIAFW